MALMYCKKCGRLVQGYYDENDKSPYYCDCCNSVTYKVPIEFLISEFVPIIKSDLKQQFIDEYIKTSPEFDQYLFEHRDEILAKQSAEFDAKMEHGRIILEEKGRVAKCPSCGSSNVSKIGVINGTVSVGIFGLASSKIGKTHKCNNCGTTW